MFFVELYKDDIIQIEQNNRWEHDNVSLPATVDCSTYPCRSISYAACKCFILLPIILLFIEYIVHVCKKKKTVATKIAWRKQIKIDIIIMK